MFDGQLVIAKTVNYVIYSPWFPRGGSNGIFSIEVIEMDGSSPSVGVDILTKNSEDPGPGATTGITFSLSGSSEGVSTASLESTVDNGMLELVRYKFTVSGGKGDWCLFRMLPAVWYDEVAG